MSKKVIHNNGDLIRAIVYSEEAATWVVASDDQTLSYYRLTGNEQITTEEQRDNYNGTRMELRSLMHHGRINFLTISRRFIISCSHDMQIGLSSPSNGSLLHLLQGHQGIVRCASVIPVEDELLSASGNPENTIFVWSLDIRQFIRKLVGHDNQINAITCLDKNR